MLPAIYCFDCKTLQRQYDEKKLPKECYHASYMSCGVLCLYGLSNLKATQPDTHKNSLCIGKPKLLGYC